MNYDEMSDFEINKAVCKALGKTFKKKYKEDVGIFANHIFRDYCNNPSDAWPIITENKISIDWCSDDDVWSAIGNDGSMFNCTNYQHENPLRAAMIVFLKMMEDS